jgi:hypothetical protein
MIPTRDLFVQFRVVNGVAYIVKNYEAFKLDEVGELIWNSIDGVQTVEQITQTVAEKYNEDVAMVGADVKEFIEDLAKAELIEV